MALQLWFPFTEGTFENKGACQDELIIATPLQFNNSGKTGAYSYRYGRVKMSAATTAKILNNKSFSFACWIYPNAETGDRTQRFGNMFGNNPMGEYNNRKFSIFNYPSCNDLHVNWMNDTTTSFMGGVWYGVFPSYQWTHVAITYDNPTMRIYINGALLTTKTGVSNSSTFAYETDIFMNPSNSNCTYINDYRIYDTCLSHAEVRELAKGLVLHYKLDEPNPNLIPIGGLYTKDSPLTQTKNSKDGFLSVPNSAFEGEPEQEYTISVECDSENVKPQHSSSGTDPSYRYWTLWLYICYTDTTKAWQNQGVYDIAVCLNGSGRNYRRVGNRHVWTYTTGSNEKYISLRVNTYSDGETDLTVNWWNIKIEKGNKATPWIPYTTEVNNKIIDSSGFGNHGLRIGNFLPTTDTPRYFTAMYKTDNETAINCGRGAFVTDSLTVSVWIKWTNKGAFISCTEAGGWALAFESGNSKIKFWCYLDDGIGYKTPVTPTEIPTGEWHMVTGVYDRINKKVRAYIDGELESSLDVDTSALIKYHNVNSLYVGAEAGGTATTFQTGMRGSYSDFRVYCTALSDDDIRDLYRTSVKIDNLGKIHAYELVEGVGGAHVKRNGQLTSDAFIEAGSNFYRGPKVVSFVPENIRNSCVPVADAGEVDLTSVMNTGVPIRLSVNADLTWENFAFSGGGTNYLLIQGASRRRTDHVYTWDNAIINSINILSLISGTDGTAHVTGSVTISAEKLELFDGYGFSMRCDYSDGNGRLSLSNIKVCLANDNAKITKGYISGNEFIEV